MGLSPEERPPAAAAETAAAVTMLANVAAAAYAAKLPTLASQNNYPDAVYPSHVLLRSIICGAGAYPSNLRPEAAYSGQYQQVVFAELRGAYQCEVKCNLRHKVTLSTVVQCLRTSFGKLILEDFRRAAREELLKAPVVLMGGAKSAPTPRPSEDVEKLYGCAQRVARLVSPMYHQEVGLALELLDATYEQCDMGPSFDAKDFREIFVPPPLIGGGWI